MAKQWQPVEVIGAVYHGGEWPVIPRELADTELRLCQQVDVDPAPSVQMTEQQLEALQTLINVATALPHIAVPTRQRNNAAKLVQTMLNELTGGNDDTATE